MPIWIPIMVSAFALVLGLTLYKLGGTLDDSDKDGLWPGLAGALLILGGGSVFAILFLVLLTTADWGMVPGT